VAFKVSDIDYETQQRLLAMLPQLMIVFVNRAGGHIDIPVKEIDGTGEYVLAMGTSPDHFTFTVYKKKDF